MQAFKQFCNFTRTSHFLIIGTLDELDDWERKMFKTEPEPMNPCFEAVHYIVSRGNVDLCSVIWMPSFDFTVENYVALSHECLHDAIKIMHRRGMNIIIGENSEQLNYLHGAIYQEFLSQLHKKRKSVLKKC